MSIADAGGASADCSWSSEDAERSSVVKLRVSALIAASSVVRRYGVRINYRRVCFLSLRAAPSSDVCD